MCRYLWGVGGCGLTHLLEAACHHAQTLGKSFQYAIEDYQRKRPGRILFRDSRGPSISEFG